MWWICFNFHSRLVWFYLKQYLHVQQWPLHYGGQTQVSTAPPKQLDPPKYSLSHSDSYDGFVLIFTAELNRSIWRSAHTDTTPPNIIMRCNNHVIIGGKRIPRLPVTQQITPTICHGFISVGGIRAESSRNWSNGRDELCGYFHENSSANNGSHLGEGHIKP